MSPASRKKSAPREEAASAARERGAETPIVGVVASAGGMDAFIELLGALPPKPGMSLVFVPHLSPTHESFMPGILARHTACPVTVVRSGDRALVNHVHVIPPNRQLKLEQGVLRLAPIARGAEGTVLDAFLHSLAVDQRERAVGVVLSGTGSSGAAGIREVKANGGLVLVQSPDTAQERSMPEAALGTGVVDLVLAPEEMPEALTSCTAWHRKKVAALRAIEGHASASDLVATNEELRAVNQELLVSTEQLQTVNERLSSVNDQLKRKVHELEGSRDDFASILQSIDAAIVVLDFNQKVRRFAGRAAHLLHLIDADVGRPIGDIAWTSFDTELADDARRVLEDSQPAETLISTPDSHRYQRRITPFRTRDDQIQGVVVTITDVTALGSMEATLHRPSAHHDRR